MVLAQLARLATVLAVVVSVICASIRIHRNTLAVHASALQQVINSFAAISLDIAKDRSFVELYLRAGKDFAAHDEVGRARHSLMLHGFLRRADGVLFQTHIQTLDTEHWAGIRDGVSTILAPPQRLGAHA